jgi:hypothetical protein
LTASKRRVLLYCHARAQKAVGKSQSLRPVVPPLGERNKIGFVRCNLICR